MSATDPEILEEFVVESTEHLADVENQLLQIEKDGADIDSDLVNTVFRAVHSVKGVAGFLGFDKINTLSHRLENVLNLIRNRQLVPTKPIVDGMLNAADDLRNMIADAENSNDVDISDHVALLDKIAAMDSSDTSDSPPAEQPASSESEATEQTTPQPPSESNETTPTESATQNVPENAEPANKPSAPVSASPDSVTASKAPTVAKKKKSEGSTSKEGAKPTENYIRVSVGTLDQMMNLAGELVLNRNRLLQFVGSSKDTGIEAVSAGIDQITSELQEAVMQTRMQPVGSVFNRFRRIVRDLSAKLGKTCDLEIEGSDVEVDKSIIEAIGDPLTHLIRNSVDHGVELPDVRTDRGKKPTGRIRLAAYHQAGKVCIDIADDGGGIDTRKLIDTVVSKGVMSAEDANNLSKREAMELIFHPGLSTAAAITDVSGRGVGMDVVRTNIEKLGGSVEIESELHKGTTIRIVLPLTLAIIPSLIVSFGKQFFAIPQVNILELVRVPAKERTNRIGKIKGAEVLRLRGELLPLIRLGDALELNDLEEDKQVDEEKQPINVVILETGQTRYGLVVEDMDDSEEIVVKPLGRHLKACPSLAGATILGDGNIALILDIAGIASKSQVTASRDHENEIDGVLRSELIDHQTLLLFANHPSEQFAIPMDLVSRIERIRTDQIEIIGNQEAIQYRDGILPLLRVEQAISSTPAETDGKLNVIVFEVANREVGLVAPEIRDIKDVEMKLDPVTLRERGVMGSLVIDEVTTRILEILDFVRQVRPEWIPDEEADSAIAQEGVPEKILFSEDSPFFRKYVGEFLSDLGYDLVSVHDGSVAWEYLLDHHEEIGLVLTDIEMPELDGFELCKQIRENPTLRHLPVIALTTLANDDALQRGREVGFDDYLIKVDREKLCTSIKRLLGQSSKIETPEPELVEV